jgi:hypothetical protein
MQFPVPPLVFRMPLIAGHGSRTCMTLFRAGAVTFSLALLAACTSNPDLVGQAFTAPGKYSLYDCAQLAKERTTVAARESELRGLIDKAETGVGGEVIAEAAYGTDYATARENLRQVSAAQAENHCSDATK